MLKYLILILLLDLIVGLWCCCKIASDIDDMLEEELKNKIEK